MRLSDILKKVNQKPSSPETELRKQQPLTPPSPSQSSEAQPAPPASESVPSSTVSASVPVPEIPSAEDIYTRLIIDIRDILAAAPRNEPFTAPVQLIESLAKSIEQKPDDILLLVDRATPDIYLYGHSANVCILSLMMGLSLGIKGEELVLLGIAALFHDLGMSKSINLALKNGKLSPAEINQIKKHPLEGSRFVDLETTLSDNDKGIIAGAILQVHERWNGTGYPNALKGSGDIGEFARIIAISDVYEALAHPRSYRERYIPHEAVKTLIASSEQDFDSGIVKAFIGRISLYPPASYVRLNTDEIGRVVGINPGLPTRPRIRIIIGQDNRRPAELRITDLFSSPTIFIKEAIDESKLTISDKKLALELKAIRWWVKGL